MTQLNTQLLQMKAERDAASQRAKEAETRAANLDAGNKRKRADALKGAIGEWYKNMVETYKSELGGDEKTMREMFDRMVRCQSIAYMCVCVTTARVWFLLLLFYCVPHRKIHTTRSRWLICWRAMRHGPRGPP